MKSVCYDDNNLHHSFCYRAWFLVYLPFLLLFHCFFSNMYEAELSLGSSLIVHFLENIPVHLYASSPFPTLDYKKENKSHFTRTNLKFDVPVDKVTCLCSEQNNYV